MTEDILNYPYIYVNEDQIYVYEKYFNESIKTGFYAENYQIIDKSVIYKIIIIYINYQKIIV